MDERALGGMLAHLAADHTVPGAQLVVVHRGRTVSVVTGHEVVGGPAVRPDSPFPVGSLTKPFTAALTMALVDDGDVGLDEPLVEHLPEFGAGAVVTLRQVLSHTAGLAANVEEDPGDSADARRWLTRHGRTEDLVHRPGTVFSYSNAGYVVAGRLVTAVTGMSWSEALDAILLAPLRIAACLLPGAGASPRAPIAGHRVAGPGASAEPVPVQHLPAVEVPTGGLALSAVDLATFASAFCTGGGASISRDAVHRMCGDQLAGVSIGPFGLADGWGLGWARYEDATNGVFLGHDGTGDGTSCHVRFEPESGTVVALTTNAGTGASLWTELVSRLGDVGVGISDHPVSSLRNPAPVRVAPAAWVGRYVNGDAEFTVERHGDDPVLSIGGRPHSTFTCHTDGRFLLREISGVGHRHVGRFLPDQHGREARYLQLSGRVACRC